MSVGDERLQLQQVARSRLVISVDHVLGVVGAADGLADRFIAHCPHAKNAKDHLLL